MDGVEIPLCELDTSNGVTSSKSGPNGGQCLKAKRIPGGVAIWNSRSNPETGTATTYTDGEWKAFIAGVRNDEFNLDDLPF